MYLNFPDTKLLEKDSNSSIAMPISDQRDHHIDIACLTIYVYLVHLSCHRKRPAPSTIGKGNSKLNRRVAPKRKAGAGKSPLGLRAEMPRGEVQRRHLPVLSPLVVLRKLPPIAMAVIGCLVADQGRPVRGSTCRLLTSSRKSQNVSNGGGGEGGEYTAVSGEKTVKMAFPAIAGWPCDRFLINDFRSFVKSYRRPPSVRLSRQF